jgi:probable rRNA maturation factor
VSIEVLNESGERVDEEALAGVARHVLDRLAVSPLAELAVSLVDLERMGQLREQYLGEQGPTDVLAFPQDELDLRGSRGVAQGTAHGTRDTDTDVPTLLGDVVLCPEYADQGAQKAGHPRQAELELLVVHGVLHLLGWDHAEPDEEREMFGLQAELLRSWRTTPTG